MVRGEVRGDGRGDRPEPPCAGYLRDLRAARIISSILKVVCSPSFGEGWGGVGKVVSDGGDCWGCLFSRIFNTRGVGSCTPED